MPTWWSMGRPGYGTSISIWLRSSGLEIVLLVLGALLLARFVTWSGRRITERIDAASTDGDALVRSEAAKHRQAVTQVLTWVAIALIWSITGVLILDRLGVPVASLVAPAAVLGAALGFGAQQVVRDLIAGFFIIVERQYGFGDVVHISAVGFTEGATGTIEEVALRPGGKGPVRLHHEQPAAQLMRRHHLVEHRNRDPRIVAEPAHPTVAWVEHAACTSLGGERQMGAIVVPDAASERPVAGRGAELLDPRVLIRRDCLVRQLPPDPMGLLGQDDPAPEPRGCQRRRTRAQPTPDDREVCLKCLHTVSLADEAAKSDRPASSAR